MAVDGRIIFHSIVPMPSSEIADHAAELLDEVEFLEAQRVIVSEAVVYDRLMVLDASLVHVHA